MFRTRSRPLARLVTLLAVAAGLFVVEPACHAALNVAKGKKPKYTGKLSSNPVIRKQQLIVDPEDIIGGSVSVRYDPAVVSLSDVLDPADFQVTGGFVQVIPEPGAITKSLLSLDAFLGGADARRAAGVAANPIETGYVQIFFDRKPSASLALGAAAGGNSLIPNLPGYKTVAQDGETGINDTHALLFDYLPPRGGDYQPRAVYDIFAMAPATGFNQDTLIFSDNPDRPVGSDQIGSARVIGALDVGSGSPAPPRDPVAVPLPPAAWTGLLALAGVGFVVWQDGRGRRLA